MKRKIGIKFSVEGFHYFPGAARLFGESVRFLEESHRHNFGIVMEISVKHNERDKEFILLKREVEDYIDRNFGKPAQFGKMSCESIAQDLMEAFDADMVQVDEDGENYSKIER